MMSLRTALTTILILAPAYALAQSAPAYTPPTGATPTELMPGAPAVPASSGTATPAATTSGAPTTPARGTGATTPAKQAQQKVTTTLIAPTPLQDASTPLQARIPGLATQPKLADIGDKLNQVVISGTPTVANGRVSIDWTTVSRSDTGQIVTLPAPLASGLRTKATELPAKTRIVAKGDADELYTAIRQLFESQPASVGLTNPTGNASKGNSSGSTPTAPAQQNTNGDVQASRTTSSDDSESSDEETTVSVDTTTEGCELRIDIAQGYVIQQESTITIVNGKEDRSACMDGATRYPIKKTGLGCADEVRDTEAQGMTRLYYVNDKGEELPVQECSLDNELMYPIVDEIGACAGFVDSDARIAYDQAERVYRNNMNVRIVVEACAPTGGGYPLETTADGCNLRDDFTAGMSYQTIRDYYLKNGTMLFVGSCYDQEPGFAHQFEECSVQVNIPAGMVYNAHRAFIDGPNGKTYRSECTPYGAGSALVATTDGCESQHYDYPALSQSRGSERLYYEAAGARQYVTQCQESTAVYNWDYELTGYNHDDSVRQSTEIIAASITLPNVGKVQVSAPGVRPDSAIIPYVYEKTQMLANGEPKEYAGCNAYIPTDEMDVYRRADSTTYTYKVGPGEPSGPVDECTRSDESRTTFSHACAGTSPDCNPKLAGPKGNTISGDPSCASGTVYPSTGFNWSKVESRTTTTMPAGAGGGTIVADWVFKNYLQLSMWSHYGYPPSGQGSCKDTGKD